MKCFVDTSALYALVTPADGDHHNIVKLFEWLAFSEAALASSNYVLLEAVSLIQKRHGFGPAKTMLERTLGILDVHWIGEEEHRAANHLWTQAKSRTLSLVDCSSFATMRLLGIRHAITLDAHFSEAGFIAMSAPPSTGIAAEPRGTYRAKRIKLHSHA